MVVGTANSCEELQGKLLSIIESRSNRKRKCTGQANVNDWSINYKYPTPAEVQQKNQNHEK